MSSQENPDGTQQLAGSLPLRDTPGSAAQARVRDAAINTSPALGMTTLRTDRAAALGPDSGRSDTGPGTGDASAISTGREGEARLVQDAARKAPRDNKTENDYESLERGGVGSPHVYRPIVPKCAISIQPGNGGRGLHIHTCPLPAEVTTSARDACAVQLISFGPVTGPRQGRRRVEGSSDDIVELRGDAAGTPSRVLQAESACGFPQCCGKKKSETKKKEKSEAQILSSTQPLSYENIPNTHFAIACMVALCFNLPLGVIAMYLSLRAVTAFQEGRPKLGQTRSRWSIILSLLGITVTTLIVSSVVFYIATKGHRSISLTKSYGGKTGFNL